MFDYLKSRAWEFFAVICLFLPFYFFDVYNEVKFKNINPEDYLEVHSVYVDDFHVGEEDKPVIIYDRQVKQNFRGTWAAKVISIGKNKNFSVCNNGNTLEYTVDHTPPKAGVSLKWYIEKDCNLKPDRYYIRTTWFIHLPGGDKKIVVKSNIFEVKEKSSK